MAAMQGNSKAHYTAAVVTHTEEEHPKTRKKFSSFIQKVQFTVAHFF